MSTRVYVLLDLLDGKSDQMIRTVHGKPGVVMADTLDGSPNAVVVIQAGDRHKLAQFTVRVISSIEPMTQSLQLLATRD